MGDVLHALPAVTDACTRIDDIHFDWVVEEGFAEIPTWHGGVRRVIPAATRRWRKHLWATRTERVSFRAQLLETQYDLVIDAQGLMKSAIIARHANGVVAGFDRASVREKLAAMCYQHRLNIDRGLHAVERQRRLFALSLGYDYLPDPPDYGIVKDRLPGSVELPGQPYIVLLHGTTWPSKRWPLARWREIGELADDAGYTVVIPWADAHEQQVANQITDGIAGAVVPRRLELGELAWLLTGAAGAVAVDTGPGHLAAALAVPCISVYGATDPALTGTQGMNQAHLRAEFECVPCLSRNCQMLGGSSEDSPCYETVSVAEAWQRLEQLMEAARRGPAGR